MAGAKSEPLSDCCDCGIKGKDRNPKEINYLFTVKQGNSIIWRGRCKKCHFETQQKGGFKQ